VPTTFFKLVVTLDDSKDRLLALAFTQTPKKMPKPGSFAGFDPGGFERDQVKITDLEQLTGLNFGELSRYDPLLNEPIPFAAGKKVQGRTLEIAEDIFFG
jgi:endonuclease G